MCVEDPIFLSDFNRILSSTTDFHNILQCKISRNQAIRCGDDTCIRVQTDLKS
jgi:hypothetical protein